LPLTLEITLSHNNIMNKLFQYLALAGTLPFIFCTALLMAGVEALPVIGQIERVLSAYGLVIAGFMAGSHWGQHLHLNNRWCLYLPVFSNLVTVLLWMCFILFDFDGFLVALVLSFLTLLLIDNRLLKAEIISAEYFRIRSVVTLIVITSLLISWLHA